MSDTLKISLSSLRPGDAAVVVGVDGEGAFRSRLMDMGFTRGAFVKVIKHAPFRDPVEYCIGGTHVTLREQEARQIIVEQVDAPHCERHGRGPHGRHLKMGLRKGPRRGRLWRRRGR